jgi:hypothetical protein
MKSMEQKSSPFLKSTAWAVLGSFLFTTVAGPFAQASLWEDRRKASSPGMEQKDAAVGGSSAIRRQMNVDFGVSASGIEVPEDLGTVIESWGGDSQGGTSPLPTIVQIEDAHGMYAAQKNSAGILNLLESQGGTAGPEKNRSGLLVQPQRLRLCHLQLLLLFLLLLTLLQLPTLLLKLHQLLPLLRQM